MWVETAYMCLVFNTRTSSCCMLVPNGVLCRLRKSLTIPVRYVNTAKEIKNPVLDRHIWKETEFVWDHMRWLWGEWVNKVKGAINCCICDKAAKTREGDGRAKVICSRQTLLLMGSKVTPGVLPYNLHHAEQEQIMNSWPTTLRELITPRRCQFELSSDGVASSSQHYLHIHLQDTL
jgi:hypothetical protein